MTKAIDRIHTIIKSLGMSARQFDMSIGASNGYTLRMKKNKASVGSDVLERIVDKYPFVNITWVVTGKGTMFGPEAEDAGVYENEDLDKTLTYREVEAIVEHKIRVYQESQMENLVNRIKSELNAAEESSEA
ncbi:hypothetical protein OOZ15_12640 [Galbibacter sp. EGI 63066]|uniref:hypothetical protein n=1 Tax=Galbibacter sp. EGI 63066 TaxID=2993559 RepID=UPI0022488A84|nr:hypothetical protein [Galbibacter sp. EGI 63066]MCX2680793.1 hypothetical protein [Galbibacter sp. EGI 63066]